MTPAQLAQYREWLSNFRTLMEKKADDALDQQRALAYLNKADGLTAALLVLDDITGARA